MELEHYHFSHTTPSPSKLTIILLSIISVLMVYGTLSLLCIILQLSFLLKIIISLTATILTTIFIIRCGISTPKSSSHSINITDTSLTYTVNDKSTTLYFEKLTKLSLIKSPKDCIIYITLRTPNQIMVFEKFPEMDTILSLIKQYSPTTCIYKSSTAALYTLNSTALSCYIVFLFILDILLTLIVSAHIMVLVPFGLIILGFYFLISYIRQTNMNRAKRILGISGSLLLISSVIGFVIGFVIFCQLVLSSTP